MEGLGACGSLSWFPMRKREYVYLHALFHEVRRDLRETGDVPAEAFDAYESYGVGPAAVHRGKDAHREAIRRCLDGIVATIDARDGEAVEAISAE